MGQLALRRGRLHLRPTGQTHPEHPAGQAGAECLYRHVQDRGSAEQPELGLRRGIPVGVVRPGCVDDQLQLESAGPQRAGLRSVGGQVQARPHPRRQAGPRLLELGHSGELRLLRRGMGFRVVAHLEAPRRPAHGEGWCRDPAEHAEGSGRPERSPRRRLLQDGGAVAGQCRSIEPGPQRRRDDPGRRNRTQRGGRRHQERRRRAGRGTGRRREDPGLVLPSPQEDWPLMEPTTPTKGAMATVKFQHGMVAPLVALFVGVVGFPLGYAFYLSVTDYKLTSHGTPKLVGANNFTATLADGAFWAAFTTTATYVVVAVVLELLLGLAIALALQKQRWASDLTRSMLLAPMFITPIAVGLIFRFLLNDQIGAIPRVLQAIGVDYDFFGPGRALYTLAFIDVWQWTPFMVLLLLAGLESVPKEPLEAARVDGARGWYVFRRVTLPLLAPVLVVAILLRCLDAMKVFEYVFATTRGGPGTETETLQYFVYQTGIQFFRLGSASSMAFVVLLLVLAIIVIAFRRLDKARQS